MICSAAATPGGFSPQPTTFVAFAAAQAGWAACSTSRAAMASAGGLLLPLHTPLTLSAGLACVCAVAAMVALLRCDDDGCPTSAMLSRPPQCCPPAFAAHALRHPARCPAAVRNNTWIYYIIYYILYVEYIPAAVRNNTCILHVNSACERYVIIDVHISGSSYI